MSALIGFYTEKLFLKIFFFMSNKIFIVAL